MLKAKLPFAELRKNFAPLKPYLLQNLWPIGLGLLCLLLVDLLQLLIPLIIKHAVDLLTRKTATVANLFDWALAVVAIALLMAVFRYIWRYLIFGYSRKVELGLRERIYSHLQTLSAAFYQRTKTGDLMARAINDINAVRMAAGMGMVALTDGLVLGLAAIGFMLSISVNLTLFSLIPAPIVIILTAIFTRRMASRFERVQQTFSSLTERVRETFAGIRVIKAYGREKWAYRRVQAQGRQYMADNLHLARTLALFFPMMTIFTNIGLAIVIWLGGRQTILGQITTGDFVAFTTYLNLLTWPMMAMGWVTNLLQRGSASMRRINRILRESPGIPEPTAGVTVSGIRGNIEFHNLDFRYPDQPEKALQDIRVNISAGQTVALVGPVGAGKSTLLQTIPRLWNPPAGTVLLDGLDVRRLPLTVLRQNIGFVPQEVFLFSDSVRQNVVFGRTHVSEKDLQDILRICGIWNEIRQLEKGLDTFLGERGITLSGGQRQRLTIARALLQNPAVLILDDALSMVDTRTEEQILNQILNMRKTATNLIVSHRVSTISRADRILVLEQGKLAEQGTHTELLRAGGVYANLYQKQLLAGELEENMV